MLFHQANKSRRGGHNYRKKNTINLKLRLLFILLLFNFNMKAQNLSIDRVEPPFWWTGMKTNTVEVLIHGKNIADGILTLTHKGITLGEIKKVENPNYLFVTLKINPGVKPSKFSFTLQKGTESLLIPYELKERTPKENRNLGLGSEDFIYLLMPDRFANGDTNNDNVPEMKEPSIKRDTLYGRHGGDIQGVINHLDYIKSLGITAIWMNPEVENNQPKESYHGYAATDLYRIDRRLGTNTLYLKYAEKCHEMGLKVIKDVVFNHIGNEHWLYKDLPAKDWVHHFDNFTRTTYRSSALVDPYGSKADKDILSKGWFDKHMPDLNQKNPQLARYLIQNSIWWAEYAGIDCFRIDTYPYPDLEFMNAWVKAIQKEYPKIGIFGETWVDEVPVQAYFAQNNIKNLPFESKLPGVTDFQLYFAMTKAFNEEFGWMNGLMHLYYTLAQDYLYKDPMKNVVFLDNHDLGRFYSAIKEDDKKLKMALTFMLTTRGIPSLYYGTEILMKNDFDWGNHDKVREEFPGGWSDHKQDKFTEAGRSLRENEMFKYIQNLATWRKNNHTAHSGKLMQFIPENEVYVYFRYDDTQTIMIILNSSKEEKQLSTARFSERMQGYTTAKDAVSGELYTNLKEIKIPAGESLVLILQK